MHWKQTDYTCLSYQYLQGLSNKASLSHCRFFGTAQLLEGTSRLYPIALEGQQSTTGTPCSCSHLITSNCWARLCDEGTTRTRLRSLRGAGAGAGAAAAGITLSPNHLFKTVALFKWARSAHYGRMQSQAHEERLAQRYLERITASCYHRAALLERHLQEGRWHHGFTRSLGHASGHMTRSQLASDGIYS